MKTNIVVSAVRVNGYWYLRVKYDENNCRVRYQQSTGLKIDQSYRKVEQARRRVLAELYEINRMDEQCEKWDISPELRYQPVSEWLKRWLDDCRESIAESTLVRYTAVVRHACQFFDEKGLALCRVSPMAMEEYRDAMLAYGYSARTIQMHLSYCRPRLPPPAARTQSQQSNLRCTAAARGTQYSASVLCRRTAKAAGGAERNRPASSRTARAPVRHAHRRNLRPLLGGHRLGEKAAACTA